jgi:hypothetical protein
MEIEYHYESECEVCGFALMGKENNDFTISQSSKLESKEHFDDTPVGFFAHDCEFTNHYEYNTPETIEITP